MKINGLVFTALIVFATNGFFATTFAEEAIETTSQNKINGESINLKKSKLEFDEDLVALKKAAKKYNGKQKREKNKVVCGKEPKLGTRVKHKVCRSHAIIKRDERRAKDLLDVNSKR